MKAQNEKIVLTNSGQTIIRMYVSDLGSITQRQRDMIREAGQRKIVYDEDCPPLSPAMREEAERMIAARTKRA